MLLSLDFQGVRIIWHFPSLAILIICTVFTCFASLNSLHVFISQPLFKMQLLSMMAFYSIYP